MMKKLRKNSFRIVLSMLGVCALLAIVFSVSEQDSVAGPKGETGKLDKMIVGSGTVSMNLDVNRLNGVKGRPEYSTLNYAAKQDTFFTVIAFNGELRGPLPSAMEMIPQGSALLPSRLSTAYRNFVLEVAPFGGEYELVIRDSSTGFHYFNVEGHEYDFDPEAKTLAIRGAAF